jgi:hypothetical protein
MGMMQNDSVTIKISPDGNPMSVPLSQIMQMLPDSIMRLAQVNPGPVGELLQKVVMQMQPPQDPNYQQGRVPTVDSQGNRYYKQNPAIPANMTEQMPQQQQERYLQDRLSRFGA